MEKYIYSPVTTYNEDEMLFETKVGLDGPEMKLCYIVFGRTEGESRSNAHNLVIGLNARNLVRLES